MLEKRKKEILNLGNLSSTKIHEIGMLDWKKRSPEEKTGFYESFSDPQLNKILGIEEPYTNLEKYSVDSHTKPINEELSGWFNLLEFAV